MTQRGVIQVKEKLIYMWRSEQYLVNFTIKIDFQFYIHITLFSYI